MGVKFGKRVENNYGFTNKEFDETHEVFFFLGLSHIVVSIFMVLFWLLIEGPMVCLNGWREKFLRFKRELNYELSNSLEDGKQDEFVEHI